MTTNLSRVQSLRLFGLLSLLIYASCLSTRQLHLLTSLNIITCVVINALVWFIIPISMLNWIPISRLLFLDCAYIGAFIALDTSLQEPYILVIAAMLASCIHLFSNRYLVGLGGRLGTQAFMTCCLLIGLNSCLHLI